MKILFCNIGWMKDYQGQADDDLLIGGGSFVNEHGYGGEVTNFYSMNGNCYGCVRVDKKTNSLNLERIEKVNKVDKDFIDDVCVVWVARDPIEKKGNVIVGWYNNARVYRYKQESSFLESDSGYWFESNEDNCVLLPFEERDIICPRFKKGFMGRTQYWYADSNESIDFIKSIKKFISNYTEFVASTKSKKGIFNTNPELKKKTEKKAEKRVIQYYKTNGYTVDNVAKENKGWDLEAKKNNTTICIEVKGLFGDGKRIILTPNEYKHFMEKDSNYKLCIVNNVMSDKYYNLYICYFCIKNKKWVVIHHKNNTIDLKPKIEEKISAIVTLE